MRRLGGTPGAAHGKAWGKLGEPIANQQEKCNLRIRLGYLVKDSTCGCRVAYLVQGNIFGGPCLHRGKLEGAMGGGEHLGEQMEGPGGSLGNPLQVSRKRVI